MVTQCVQQVLHAAINSFAKQQQSQLSVAEQTLLKIQSV